MFGISDMKDEEEMRLESKQGAMLLMHVVPASGAGVPFQGFNCFSVVCTPSSLASVCVDKSTIGFVAW